VQGRIAPFQAEQCEQPRISSPLNQRANTTNQTPEAPRLTHYSNSRLSKLNASPQAAKVIRSKLRRCHQVRLCSLSVPRSESKGLNKLREEALLGGYTRHLPIGKPSVSHTPALTTRLPRKAEPAGAWRRGKDPAAA